MPQGLLLHRWQQQLSLRLSAAMLVALLLPMLLLGQDLVASQLPWEFDDERIFRWATGSRGWGCGRVC
jgi:hypothetical protein